MKVKVSEASDATLDWAVAKCESLIGYEPDVWYWKSMLSDWWRYRDDFNYSTDWSQGGPIVDKMIVEGMEVWQGNLDLNDNPVVCILEILNGKKYIGQGTTLLIAAMRCYVLYKLGEEVEVPSELS